MFLSLLSLNNLSSSDPFPWAPNSRFILIGLFEILYHRFTLFMGPFGLFLPQQDELNLYVSCELRSIPQSCYLTICSSSCICVLHYSCHGQPPKTNGQILCLRKSMLMPQTVSIFTSRKYGSDSQSAMRAYFRIVTELEGFTLALAIQVQVAECFSPGFISL